MLLTILSRIKALGFSFSEKFTLTQDFGKEVSSEKDMERLMIKYGTRQSMSREQGF